MNQSGKKEYYSSGGRGGHGYKQGSGMGAQDREDSWSRRRGEELKDLSKIDAAKIVEISDDVGKRLKEADLKINQIRRFLDEVRQIESDLKRGRFNPDRIILLRPKLAYAVGRQPKVKDLMNVLDPALQSGAKSEENFNKLLRLIEGIVAYHRYYGGSN
ncbi:MAG: type III-A CRISPR-associated protein Csm2 [Deltaproteobacteria bacterium CG03_land_8_20_14_0_80_45_14]|nr:MAG: type III-A CRISPR-associated protein Csm2 [Deltaproteobacteria bacterium CG03_land_8_20_14_0_80_45_14]